jgi:hypothetical protein
MKILSNEFFELFNGTAILRRDIESKILIKHKVYENDLYDVLNDEFAIVIKGQQRQINNKGQNYEIYGEVTSGRVLFIVGILFPDGNLYIITSYWATKKMINFYEEEREVLEDE